MKSTSPPAQFHDKDAKIAISGVISLRAYIIHVVKLSVEHSERTTAHRMIVSNARAGLRPD